MAGNLKPQPRHGEEGGLTRKTMLTQKDEKLEPDTVGSEWGEEVNGNAKGSSLDDDCRPINQSEAFNAVENFFAQTVAGIEPLPSTSTRPSPWGIPGAHAVRSAWYVPESMIASRASMVSDNDNAPPNTVDPFLVEEVDVVSDHSFGVENEVAVIEAKLIDDTQLNFPL